MNIKYLRMLDIVLKKSIQTVVTDLSLKGKEGLLCKGKV